MTGVAYGETVNVAFPEVINLRIEGDYYEFDLIVSRYPKFIKTNVRFALEPLWSIETWEGEGGAIA
jgi:hypothetical protein